MGTLLVDQEPTGEVAVDVVAGGTPVAERRHGNPRQLADAQTKPPPSNEEILVAAPGGARAYVIVAIEYPPVESGGAPATRAP